MSKKTKDVNINVNVFAKIVDANLDCDGNIHITIKKNNDTSSRKAVQKMREMINKDCTLTLIPWIKPQEASVVLKGDIQ